MKTYFIQAASGPVKIGKTKSVRARLAVFSCASHETLSVLGVIEGDEERRLHRRFESTRIRGEWFQPSAALLGFIATHASPIAETEGDPILVDLPMEADFALRRFAAAHRLTPTSAARLLLIEALSKGEAVA